MIISALGWAWGSACIVTFGFLSLYCNFMLASVSLFSCLISTLQLPTALSDRAVVTQLHEYGGKRNIRYRDLNAAILGRWAYYPVR